jgi:WD40 repeat protein
MDNASLRPLVISPFACGMPQQESFWWVRLLDTPIQSFLPYSHRTGSALLRPREITQFVCGDAARWEVLVVTSTGHTGKVNSIAFSPDGRRVASASCNHTIRVWDAATVEAMAGPFIEHTDWLLSVAFSPNGQHIASASRFGCGVLQQGRL